VNYRSMGATPAILAGALALGAFCALGLSLMASVRQRRRELALLKTFGFTRRQLASAVAWQATTTVLIGTIVGIPLGIVAGKALWDLFAKELYAIPVSTVPALYIAIVGLAALVLANLVAAQPGRIAARTPTAILLESE
jgi:ABC-type antimicrobial peptide transport system permease subunit